MEMSSSRGIYELATEEHALQNAAIKHLGRNRGYEQRPVFTLQLITHARERAASEVASKLLLRVPVEKSMLLLRLLLFAQKTKFRQGSMHQDHQFWERSHR
jgi:hypothetical protein